MEGDCPHYTYWGTPLHLGDGAGGFKSLCGKEIYIKLIIVIFLQWKNSAFIRPLYLPLLLVTSLEAPATNPLFQP